MLKWLAVWVLMPLLIVATVTLTASFLRVPVPAEEHQNCLQAAQKANDKNSDCPLKESVLDRGMRDPVAYYTLWLTLFTGALAVVGIGQGLLASQQIRLAREEFIATHRPRLRVRRIWPKGKKAALIGKGETTEICIMIANFGETDARITGLSTYVIFERDKFSRTSFEADSAMSKYAITVPRGKMVLVNVFASLDITPSAYADNAGCRGDQFEVLAIGAIEYEDPIKGVYLTGFSRLYDPGSNRFRVVPEGDPEDDREYSY